MRGSSVLREERKIGLKKGGVNGCKTREMKNSDAEMRSPREKEKKERLEKLLSDREELRKMKRDVLISRELSKRREKKRRRSRTGWQDRRKRRERRCRIEGIKMAAKGVVALGEAEVTARKMVPGQVEEHGDQVEEVGGIENRVNVMNGQDHVVPEAPGEKGTEMTETGCLQDVALLHLEIVMDLTVDPAVTMVLIVAMIGVTIVVMIDAMMVLLSVVDLHLDVVSLLHETIGGVEEEIDPHAEIIRLLVVEETKMIEVVCGEVVVAVEIAIEMKVLDLEEEEVVEVVEVALGNLVVEAGEIENSVEMMDPEMMTVDHVVVALNDVALVKMTTDPP